MRKHNAVPCVIDGCANLAWARGWCRKHYARWRANGDPHKALMRQSPAGVPEAFLATAYAHQADECLFWPFAKNGVGYAQINFDGRKFLVTRLVCERAHGPAPSPRHQAAHSCGNGHLGCIAPSHLRWATPKENGADMVLHGRSTRGRSMATQPLSQGQVLEIYKRARNGESQTRIAAAFGVSQTAVSKIKLGKTWDWLTGQKVAA